jgi:hypothetical protein
VKKLFKSIAPSMPLISTLIFQLSLIFKFGIGQDLDVYYLISGFNAFFMAVLAGLTLYWAYPNFKNGGNKMYFDSILSLGVLVNIILAVGCAIYYYYTMSFLPLIFTMLITPSVILSLYMYTLYSEGNYVFGSVLSTVPNLLISVILIKVGSISISGIVLGLVIANYVIAMYALFNSKFSFSLKSLGLLKSSNSVDLFRSSVASKAMSPIDRATLASGDEGFISVYALYERLITIFVTLFSKYHELLLLSSIKIFKEIFRRFLPAAIIAIAAYFFGLMIFKEAVFDLPYFPSSLKGLENFLTVLLICGPISALLLWMNSLLVAELYSKKKHGYIFKVNVLIMAFSLLVRFVIIVSGLYIFLPVVVVIALSANLFFFYRHLEELK